MSDIKELIEARVESICQLGYGRFHYGYKPAARSMLAEAVGLHGREPAAEVAKAVLDALGQLVDESDRRDAQRLEVLRYSLEHFTAACNATATE